MPSPGSRIGHFTVLARLGAGGMGEVWRAHDERLGRDIAIKVLPAELAGDPERLRRFEQEARATAALNHPNILAIYDIGSHEGRPFIVEELLEGRSLRETLANGAMPVGEAVRVVEQISHGLAAAHARGIVHRDLKPENVFVTVNGAVKVLDFGLARVATAAYGPARETSLPTETVPGTVLGTAGYMAPEQVRAEPADPRSDVFACGCVLYELLTGRRAFARQTAAETLTAILREPVEAPSRGVAGVSPAVDRVVARCLEKRPEDRFQSARELASALASTAAARMPNRTAGRVEPSERRPSIAVLPFANLSADPEQEYFCDGMAEEIINALAHVEGMRVVARTSAFAFKGRTADIREIGGALDVSAVLEGSVRKAGNRLRITAQLIDVADGYHLWSERFDRTLEDVFAIQDEIALAIVDNLKVRLLASEKASVTRRHTEDIDAHNAYLRGLFEWNRMTPQGFSRCQELFREAIRLDPGFAPAYAQLADSITSVTWWADQPPALALAQALPLAEKALALDPGLAHAHGVVGHIRAFIEREWREGERSLRRAVELAPNSALPQTYLALLLMVAGDRNEEAATRARLAARLDPLSPALNAWAGTILHAVGELEEGLAMLERQAAAAPEFWMAHCFLTLALAEAGRWAEAKSAAEKAFATSGGNSLTVSQLACLCYRMGERDRADELFAQLQARARAGYVPPMFLARVHLTRGEQDAALEKAREALASNDPWISPQRLYSRALGLSDPRIDALIESALP
jgi:serine/threonine protein kinase/tetratricopeptide (TPR) repeat protein